MADAENDSCSWSDEGSGFRWSCFFFCTLLAHVNRGQLFALCPERISGLASTYSDARSRLKKKLPRNDPHGGKWGEGVRVAHIHSNVHLPENRSSSVGSVLIALDAICPFTERTAICRYTYVHHLKLSSQMMFLFFLFLFFMPFFFFVIVVGALHILSGRGRPMDVRQGR